ncbi:MAG: DNA primase [Dehalococcoidia bacterium]|nr:DNA primase [Dehalococcoidia bacterium]
MDTVDEIKQRLDIVEVISSYVPDLKKSGRNFKAVCPFHSEKTPSFFVFPERQSWHCFGACGSGGDMFAFIMRKEGVDFREALRILAERAGVAIVQRKADEGKSEADRLKEINEAAAEFYHNLLFRSAGGQSTREYLARRGVTEKTMRQFLIGYSPDSWDALRQELLKRGYLEGELTAAGLLIKKEREAGTYDRFRNRLMFPIRDMAGRVIGFGARALDDSVPKYLNSPQTLIFDKSSSLYGIDLARTAIRKDNLAVIVEGYMDTVVAHQHGFTNVVASLGTALTEKHVGIVKKLTNRLVLALDADAAGEMATLRGIEVASHTFDQKVVPLPTPAGVIKWEEELDAEISVMVLPEGKDPDDVIRGSPEEWERLLKQAVPVIDYTFDLLISKLDITKAKDKSQAADQLLPLIAEIKHPVRQAHYLQRLARTVGLDERKLNEELNRIKPKAPGPRRETRPSTAGGLLPHLPSSDPLAEYCLYLLFTYPDLRSRVSDLRVDYFLNTEDREILLAWQGTSDPEVLRAGLDSSLREHLDELMSKTVPPLHGDAQERALRQCINRLRERWLRELKAKEQILIAELEAADNATDLYEIQKAAVRLNAELGEVFLYGKERRKRASAEGESQV